MSRQILKSSSFFPFPQTSKHVSVIQGREEKNPFSSKAVEKNNCRLDMPIAQ
jgi:hypothetical protein